MAPKRLRGRFNIRPEIKYNDGLYTYEYGLLGQFPMEIMLHIIDIATIEDVASLCLTNKSFYNLLNSKYLLALKVTPVSTKKFLRALERDLPWDLYQCHGCNKLHAYKTDQSRCRAITIAGVKTHRHEDALHWNNVKVVRALYYAQKRAKDSLMGPVSTFYFQRSYVLGFFGTFEVRTGKDEKLYLKSQKWIRWNAYSFRNLFGNEPELYKYYYCYHASRFPSYPITSAFGESWDCEWNDIEQMSIDELASKAVQRDESELLIDNRCNHQTKLPQRWKRSQPYSCRYCKTEIEIDFGFTHTEMFPKHARDIYNYPFTRDSIAPLIETKEKGRPVHTIRDRLKTLGARWKTPRTSASTSLLWCDTMVITKWMCLGSIAQQKNSDWYRHQLDVNHITNCSLPPFQYQPGSIKAAFENSVGQDRESANIPPSDLLSLVKQNGRL